MKDDVPSLDRSAERLAEAIDRVQHDVEMVAFWACAFGGLVRPIPDYQIEGVTRLSRTPKALSHTRIGIRT
jgi:hypothetical protein